MTLTDLLEEFNIVIDTHEGLSELRSLILGLAVRGKLVPQDPKDEPASVLLKKIDAEKQRLYEAGEIRKPKDLSPLNENEIPFEIPENWEWVRNGNLILFQNGYAFKSSLFQESGIGIIRIGDLQNGEVVEDSMKYISKEDAANIKDDFLIKKGDMLIAMSGATTGKIAINNSEKEYLLNQRVGKINPVSVNQDYIYRYLNTKIEENLAKSLGSAIPNLSTKQIEELEVPLPPLEEQHRIVAKIESLFAEVDELEAQLEDQNKLDEKLQRAVNAEVQQAPHAEASRFAWNIITSNFETLYYTPESIDNLKKNILNEAVRGRLVPQDSKNAIDEVIVEIDNMRIKLCEEGERRLKKRRDSITNDEIPWDVPKQWKWLRFSDFILFIDYRGKTPKKVESGIPLITAKNIRNGHINDHPREFIEEAEYNEWMTRGIPIKGDLLFTTEAPLGNIAVIDFNYKFALAQRSICFRLLHKDLNPYYIMYFMMSDTFKSYLTSYSTGMTAKGIKSTKLKKLPFPLPPLEEQHRVVQRIEELFAICDSYKAQLEQREQVNERLVKGLVQEVLEGV